jgi:hypothetical protein
MADYWIKLYIDIIHDSKMGILPDRLWRRVIELFLLAGHYRRSGELPGTQELAWELRVSTDDLEMDLRQVEMTGIITRTATGWMVNKFAQRQAAVPTAERMRNYREKQHHEQYNGEPVTTELRSVTQITDNRLTDVDTETESEEESGDDKFSLLPLSKAFVEASGLPEMAGGAQSYYTALQEMKTAGVEPIDLTTAISELREKKYTIVRPRSCVVAAINCMGKRLGKNGRKKEQYTGPNGEVIEL